MPAIELCLEELWLIQEKVRQHDHQGQAWNRDDMGRIHQAIISLNGNMNDTREVDLSVGFLWCVEAQVSQREDLGRTDRGRVILRKVFSVLHNGDQGDEDEWIDQVERDANRDASADRPSGGADAEA